MLISSFVCVFQERNRAAQDNAQVKLKKLLPCQACCCERFDGPLYFRSGEA
jgi:hypothetical protein